MKRRLQIFLLIGVITLIFWLAETAFFIVRDGWHIVAKCNAEIICDGIVQIGLIITLGGYIIALVMVIHTFADAVDAEMKDKEMFDFTNREL
jgi:hypothetical protein